MKNRLFSITIFLIVLAFSPVHALKQVTVTLGYPDHPDYFIYSIPPSDENARFGGEYYFKVENTGTEELMNWEMFMTWKTLNKTWGVVTKTSLNALTGEIKLTGPNWDQTLSVSESFVLNGEWIPSGSVEDWIDFLPRSISMVSGGEVVEVIYDTQGTIQANSYAVQKIKPFDPSRKTFASKKIVAYFPIFDAENAWCSLQKYGANIDQLRVQLYSISSDGRLRAGQDLPAGVDPYSEIDFWYDSLVVLGVVDFCIQNGIELVPVIYNYNSELQDFDQLGVHTMMTNASLRSTHLQDILGILQSHPSFAGIDVDYESLHAQDRDNYALFMEDLSTIVHSQGKILTTAVHTKVGHGTWYGPQAQDFERIGNAVDELLLMTYDLHWATSPTYSNPPPTAGCQSTPDWINDVANFALSEINDPSKIQIGLPYYGYRWKAGFENHTLNDPGLGLTYRDAQELMIEYGVQPSAIQRDANGKDPYFQVQIEGQNWVCYFQDSLSLDYKLSALLENDLKDYIGGVGIWRLGSESDGMWNAVQHALFNTNAQINASPCEENGGENVGLKEVLGSKLIVSPNPFNTSVRIQFQQPISGVLTLTDMLGNIIRQEEVYEESIIELNDTETLSKGSYIITLTGSGFNRSQLVVKQ